MKGIPRTRRFPRAPIVQPWHWQPTPIGGGTTPIRVEVMGGGGRGYASQVEQGAKDGYVIVKYKP